MQRTTPRIILSALALAAAASAAYTPPAKVVSALDKYRNMSELTSAAGSDLDGYAKNLVTWQMDHGGFCKAYATKYKSAWDGTTEKCSWTNDGVALGTYDNNATVQEMRFLATRYKETADNTVKSTVKASFAKAAGFVLTSQLPNGGWPQVYPKRDNYSDMATYNDNAMIRLMVLIKDIVDKKSPFDSDILASGDIAKLKTALDKGVDFTLKAQIVNGGAPTVWCAQHDPSTYKPVGARSYELASKSGSESAGIVWFLMNWPDQSAAVQKAAKGALTWYRKNKVTNLKYSSGTFTATTNGALWYRFYDVDADSFFFCDRDGESTKTRDITKISEERRTGYQWAGDYGSALLDVESAYLAALPSVVGVAPRMERNGGVAFADGRILVRDLEDGIWHGVVVDASGERSAPFRAVAVDGRLEVRMPDRGPIGASWLRLTAAGRSARIIPLPAVR